MFDQSFRRVLRVNKCLDRLPRFEPLKLPGNLRFFLKKWILPALQSRSPVKFALVLILIHQVVAIFLGNARPQFPFPNFRLDNLRRNFLPRPCFPGTQIPLSQPDHENPSHHRQQQANEREVNQSPITMFLHARLVTHSSLPARLVLAPGDDYRQNLRI